MTGDATPHHGWLLLKAGEVLHLTQGELAARIGVSRRTVVRWTGRVTSMGPTDLCELARAVYPADFELAAQCATAAGTTPEKLGLVPPAPPPPPAPPVARLVDIVVCAVADVLDLPPRLARPALLAGVRRARELGLKLGEMEQGLVEEAKALTPRGRGPGGKPTARRA